MHAKSDSDVTSLAPSSPPRSPPRRPAYFVMSPSEKLSSAGGSPAHPQHPTHHRYFATSPAHHSLHSSTTRFSASLRTGYWRKVPQEMSKEGEEEEHEEEDDDEGEAERWGFRFYAILFAAGFLLLFTLFSIVLWGSSRAYRPRIIIQSFVFRRYNVQAGSDSYGVPTTMISLNSTVKMRFWNPATFFGVHVSSTPLQLYHYDLLIASGHMKEFYASRKEERVLTAVIRGKEVPVYGGGADLTSHNNGGVPAVVRFRLTFIVRARANVLGWLVRSKFYRPVRCSVYLHESRLGHPVNLRHACEYG